MFNRPRAFALSTTILFGSTLAFGETAATTVKDLTAAPQQYVNQAVTVTGQFVGRSVPGAGPTAPLNRSRWDFLLAVEDSVVWVSGIRPAGSDFDLNPRSSADAGRGRWLEVTGTLRMASTNACRDTTGCSQLWIEASDLKGAFAPATAPRSVIRSADSAPVVVFHDPIDDETGVARDATVRFQFSRSIVAETLSERIRVSYASPRPLSATPIPKFTARYDETLRAVTIAFTEPLAASQRVQVELLDGIAATNGVRVAPRAYRFTTGN